MRSVKTNQQEQPDEDDDNDEEVEVAAPEWPLRFQVESVIDVTRNVALYSSNGEEMSLVITKFEKLLTEDRIASKNKQIFVAFSNPSDFNVVIVKLLKFFKETVKTVTTLCNVSVNF